MKKIKAKDVVGANKDALKILDNLADVLNELDDTLLEGLQNIIDNGTDGAKENWQELCDTRDMVYDILTYVTDRIDNDERDWPVGG
jgi:DNA phosphorothioation-dependent restriction protein DptG